MQVSHPGSRGTESVSWSCYRRLSTDAEKQKNRKAKKEKERGNRAEKNYQSNAYEDIKIKLRGSGLVITVCCINDAQPCDAFMYLYNVGPWSDVLENAGSSGLVRVL